MFLFAQYPLYVLVGSLEFLKNYIAYVKLNVKLILFGKFC